MATQKTPRSLYPGQCLVTFSLNLEVLYVALECGTWYRIVITKRHLKIIPSTFGTIFRRKNDHKWPDGNYY